jgi:hypothetical protein
MVPVLTRTCTKTVLRIGAKASQFCGYDQQTGLLT